MGFGLATVKKIVEERHKGTIIFQSRQGAGTEITLILPREQS